MSLSPDDIVGYRFKQSLRGYAIDEVDELLDRLADQVERTTTELADLRERVRVAEEAAESARTTEATLQRTLVAAQETADRQLADAEATARTTLAAATEEADGIRRAAEDDARRTVAAAQEAARREVEAARARVREAADRHAQLLAEVAEHRDALRENLASLEGLAASALPAPSADLTAGEQSADPASPTRAAEDDQDHEQVGPIGDSDDAGDARDADDDVAGAPSERRPFGSTLRVRVRDDPDGSQAPLGSDPSGEG